MTYCASYKYLVLAGCLLGNTNAYAWQTLIGDNSSRTNQTFSFGIKSHYVQQANRLIMVGAENPQEGKNYALSRISLHDYKIVPCAPEQATVNSVYDQPNPLYDAAIQHLVCAHSTHAVVYNPAHTSFLYDVNYGNPEHEVEVLSTIITDASGKPCDNIVHLAANGDGITFAALKTDTNQSEIALISYSEKSDQFAISDDDFKKLEKEAAECKDDPKRLARLRKGLDRGEDGKPFRKVVTKLFKQETALVLPEQIKDITTLCWNSGTGCLYVGVSYKTSINDQSCGILVGRLKADKSISLEPFATDYIDIFREGTIDNLTPFATSTGSLDYILLANSKMPQSIYSLALCNERVLENRKSFEHQGKLAALFEKPQDIFESSREKFLGRQFNKPFVSTSNGAASVGRAIECEHLYAGPLNHITVLGDAIFATVTDPIDGHSAGVYQSQALYDSMGRIAGWTLWQKTVEQEGLDFAIINNSKNNLLIFSQDMQGEKGTRNARVSKWPEQATDEIAQLIAVAQKEFVENNLEIKKVIDFNMFTHGLAGKNLTLLMSDSKLVIAQMPNFAYVMFDKKSIEVVGTPTCAQIGISSDEGWFFVGGTHGLAKMVNADGSGWHMPNGLQQISELESSIAKRMGDYTMVRKLLFDQGMLYVLTDSCVDRIDLATTAVTRLAAVEDLCKQRYGIFYDLIISYKCALLATSTGLMRVGNGKDIKSDNECSLNWTPVSIPETVDLPLFLLPVSISGNPHDWAKGAGQIYIITGSYTKKGAHVHRFATRDVVDYPIDDATIAPVPDLLFKDRIGDIGSLLSCSDCFLTDGLFYLAPFRQKKSRALILYNGLTKARTTINLDLAVEDTITGISRNSAHGNWLVSGSFGLKTNI